MAWNPFSRNGRFRVAYRRANQWLRTKLYRHLRPRKYRSLLCAQAIIASSPCPSKASLAALRDINWRIGSGSIYRFTEEELAQQARWADAIIDKIRREESDGVLGREAEASGEPDPKVSGEDVLREEGGEQDEAVHRDEDGI